MTKLAWDFPNLWHCSALHSTISSSNLLFGFMGKIGKSWVHMQTRDSLSQWFWTARLLPTGCKDAYEKLKQKILIYACYFFRKKITAVFWARDNPTPCSLMKRQHHNRLEDTHMWFAIFFFFSNWGCENWLLWKGCIHQERLRTNGLSDKYEMFTEDRG